MLRVIIALLAALAASAQTSAQSSDRRSAGSGQTSEPGSVRGTVVGPAGEPLRKAEVTLRALGGRGGTLGRPGMMSGMGPGFAGGVWTHTTDASGTFQFADLPPGQYTITAQRNGYVRFDGSRPGTRSGTGVISVAAGQTASGITVKMRPQGVVAGKVTDEDGDPMAYVSVQVLRERWAGGRRNYTPLNADSTNDLGEFRIAGLMPGRYFLMVSYSRPEAARPQPRATGVVNDLTYASTFYPGVFDISQATPVQVQSGQELRGMDLQMRKVPTFRIRGKVVDETGKPAQSVSVMAAPSEGYFIMRSMGVARNPDGSFEIGGIQPGSYTLIANRGGREGVRSVARLPVQVGSRDLDGVTIQLQQALEISGTVRAPEGTSVGNARVTLESLDPGMPFGAMGTSGPVEAGGSWTVASVAPGRYRFSVTPMPQGMYLKAISVQGQDISAGAMITAAAAGIVIELGAKAPTVNGTVVGSEREPVPGATVVLVPESGRREQYWLFRQASSDNSGAFSLAGVPPGQYTVYAFREVEDGAWFSPEFLRTLEGKGVALKLAEGSAESLQLTPAL